MMKEDFLAELKAAVVAGPEGFKAFLQARLTEGLSEDLFDTLIDYLEDLPETGDSSVVALSQIMLDLFPESEFDDPQRHGQAWYFRVLALLHQPEPLILLRSITAALDYCEKDGINYGTGYIICRNVKSMLSPELVGEDSLLLVIKRIIAFFTNIEEFAQAIEFMLDGATIFSRQGAYQPAERLLYDAQVLARDNNRGDLLIDVGFAIAQASIDQHDHSRALEIYKDIFQHLAESGEAPPDQHLFNYAMVNMRQGNTTEALTLFTELDEKHVESDFRQFSITMHIALCKKNLGDWSAAEKGFYKIQGKAEAFTLGNVQDFDLYVNDLLIEYHLCFALILGTNDKPTEALPALLQAVTCIELAMQYTIKPHYRKGIRSQYNNRILAVCALIWSVAKPAEFLPILIALKKNSQSDWLTLLSWVAYVNGLSHVAAADKQKLNAIVDRLYWHSGMILGSYQEKYDDPFEFAGMTDRLLLGNDEEMSNIPWQDMALFAAELIHRYGLKPVFALSDLASLSGHLTKKLNDEHILLFVFLTPAGYTCYVLNADSVYQDSLETRFFKPYWEALSDYRNGKIVRDDFLEPFTDIVKFIDEQLQVIWDQIKIKAKKGLYIFPGVMDPYFPLPQACLYNDDIKNNMGSEDFIFLQCPIMFQQNPVDEKIEKVEILINKERELALFSAEAASLLEIFPLSNVRSITTDKDITDNLEHINYADAVHMITHGQPISNFREPVYASLAPKCFSIGTLQQFHSAKSQLYLLNSCNAGDTVNSNSEMVKVTNEIIGFTTILMQNRRAKVIASKWPLLDTLGFIFTQLFYRQLAESNDINKAYARSIYLLATQPNTYFLPLLAGVKDEALRAEKEALLNRANLPFGSVYLYTTLNLYSLV